MADTAQPTAPVADQIFNVNGMVAVVTGGGTGIGAMMAKTLALNGAAKVYILGRRKAKLEETIAAIGKPDVVVAVECDVTSKPSLEAAVKIVSDDAGFLNLLLCNSGIGGPTPPRVTANTSLEEFLEQNYSVPMEDYTQTFNVNVSAVWYTTMAFLPLLDAGNKKGNVIQKSQMIATSSIAGFNKVQTGGYAYSQSKAACTHLVKNLAVVLPTWDIRANGICPGLYPSEMSAPIVARGGVGKEAVPLGRMGDELDMGGTVLYLASRAGAYLNGNVVISDGGRLQTFPSTF